MKEKKEKPGYNMWQNTAYMIKVAWKVRKAVLFTCLLSAGVAVLQNVAELFIAPVILEKVEQMAPLGEVVATILGFVGVLLLLALVQGYLPWNLILMRLSPRMEVILRVNKKSLITAYPNTENPEILAKRGKAWSAIQSDNSSAQAIWVTLENLLKNIAGFGIYLLLVTKLTPVLVVVVVGTTVVGYLVNKQVQKWGYLHRKEQNQYIHRIQYLGSKSRDRKMAKDIRIFGMRSWLDDVYLSTMNLLEAFLLKKEKRYIFANILDVILAALRNGAAYVYLLVRALDGGMAASEFLLYFSAVSGFSNWITGILNGFSELHKQSLELSALREFLETPEPFLYEEGERITAEEGKTYELRLKNVSFRYPKAEQDTIHCMNLTIRPGEKLAIVGLNGAGKTTLVKLLCGLYDPTEGQVLLNGEDIRKYNRKEYYRLFSTVFQQFSVLEATVSENVSQRVEGIDTKRVKECINKAGLTEKIESLPKRYEHPVGRLVYEDGVEFSGGELQRLMLARALYKNASMLILDEPTAALDPIAEDEIYQKYHAMTEGKTSLFISHRLASTRFCDRILFLEKGSIVEEGNHEELLRMNGKYQELYQVQSKYYQEGREF